MWNDYSMRRIAVLSATLCLPIAAQAQDLVKSFGAPNLDTPVAADYDGDGRADFAIYRGATGEWKVLSSTGAIRTTRFGAANLDRPVPADYDGDGRTDLAVYRPTTSEFIALGSKLGLMRTMVGPKGSVPVPADYDGDGRADPAVSYNSFFWFIQRSSEGLLEAFGGRIGSIPAPADYDGDGRTDIAWFHNDFSTGLSIRTLTGYTTRFELPRTVWPNARNLSADYDGDGLHDIAIANGSNTEFYGSSVFMTSSPILTGACPGRDFNGDGAADRVFYDKATGIWRVWYSVLAPKLQSVVVNTPEVVGGQAATFTVTLTGTLDSYMRVRLLPSDYSALLAGADVRVEKNSLTATFTVPTRAVEAEKLVDLKAWIGNAQPLTATVKLNPVPPPASEHR